MNIATEQAKPVSETSIYEQELHTYRLLNQYASRGGIVLFGSSFARNIPANELTQSLEVNCTLYNRSLTDLSIFDAEKVIGDCVIRLKPHKVLIQLGETDLMRGYRTVQEMINAYEDLIRKLKTDDRRRSIVLVSVVCGSKRFHVKEWNRQIQKLAGQTGCLYTDISMASGSQSPSIKAFGLLRCCMIDRLNFIDAMTTKAI